MKSITLKIFTTLGALFILSILYIIISARHDIRLYNYWESPYSSEIDFLIKKDSLSKLCIESTHKSGNQGSIFFATYDSLSKIIVFEAGSFQNISIEEIRIKEVPIIKVNQNRTYCTIVKDSFPVIEQMLNPPKSSFVNVIFKLPSKLLINENGGNYKYCKGNFRSISFWGKKNISMATFNPENEVEIIVLATEERAFFIIQSGIKTRLLDILNPSVLEK